MKYVMAAMVAAAAMVALFSCRSQKEAAGNNGDSVAVDASPERHIGKDAGATDRSLIDSESRFAGQVVHFQPENRVHIIGGKPVAVRPRALAFRMSGDYSGNVPLTLAADGTLASYPAPSDVLADSAPLPLADGWWLDRSGVTEQTVFSRYTLEQYAALKEPPTPQDLLASVIPGAKVTAVSPLPMYQQEALADTAAVNEWLRNHTFTVSK